MKTNPVSKLYFASIVVAMGVAALMNSIVGAQPGPSDGQEGVDVLTRGPVHEAFAEVVTYDPEPGIVAPRQPPAAIEELPPDQKPEGDHVAWIPGYWAWDDEREDYLWVSGVWRALPPGRQWVPGYWGASAGGAQWVSGYWADASAEEIEYLPEPPATVESGPNIAAPMPDQTWMPGCWVWQQGRYLWRPGYWAAVQPDWDWVPAHYVWAPRGYVYVDGYWDYSIARRGVLFAPLYFSANVYSRRGFTYSPSVVINPAVFASQLFLRPNYQHYYFGDYYGSQYSAVGFHPWYSYNSRRFGYDPIYVQQRWQNRNNRGWAQKVEADFQNRVAHQDQRPPRTWAAQQLQVGRNTTPGDRGFVIAARLDQVTRSNDGPLRFRPIDQAARQRMGQYRQGVQQLREERQKLEAAAPAGPRAVPSQQYEPPRVRLPRSPIIATSPDPRARAVAPPQAHQIPQPDRQVRPQPRTAARIDSSKAEPATAPPRLERPTRRPPAQPQVNQPTAPAKGPVRPQPKAAPPAQPQVKQPAAPAKGPMRPQPKAAPPAQPETQGKT